MKITYDREADAMLIIWNEKAELSGSKKLTDGHAFLLMIDTNGNPMGIEILYVSKYVTNPEKIDYRDITSPEHKQKSPAEK